MLRALMEVNLRAPALLARAAVGMAAYSASTAALTAFDATVARELRREGVRVVDVRPPRLATGLERRPIMGEPPTLPHGQDPAEWAARVADARTEVGSEG